MSGAIEYAQARIQARHGARPEAAAWASLHAAITLPALLETARASSLESWVGGLDPGCTRDELELRLRERLRARIEEVARWMPEPWRPAVLWARALLDLPALQHLLRARPAHPWMTRDPAVAPRLATPPDEERAARVRREWLAAWRRLWPSCAADEREGLEALARTVESHVDAFARAPPDEAANLRAALRARAETLFRRHPLAPAAVFAHLLLLALEAERVRAEVEARIAEHAEAP